MHNEEHIKSELEGHFPFLKDKVRISRERRMWLESPAENFDEVLAFLFKKLSFTMLCTITGLDEGENLSAYYHLATPNGIVFNLKRSAPRTKPVVTTVTGLFPGAYFYEKELIDLLGFEVQGLADGPRYPLPDDFPRDQYPLRKDWKGVNP